MSYDDWKRRMDAAREENELVHEARESLRERYQADPLHERGHSAKATLKAAEDEVYRVYKLPGDLGAVTVGVGSDGRIVVATTIDPWCLEHIVAQMAVMAFLSRWKAGGPPPPPSAPFPPNTLAKLVLEVRASYRVEGELVEW